MPTLTTEDRRLRFAGEGTGEAPVDRAEHVVNLDAPELFTMANRDAVAHCAAGTSTGKHTWPASPATTRTS